MPPRLEGEIMGITITAANSKYDFFLGYGGFFSLRKNIASAYNKEFGEHYGNLIYCHTPRQFEEHDKISNLLISQLDPDEKDADIFDFLYQSDCSGKISYKTCKKIYDLIKDIDFGDRIFTYGANSDGKDYEYLKEFLKECYSHRRQMRWE